MLLVRRLGVSPGHRRASLAVRGLQLDRVTLAQAGDRTAEHGLIRSPPADVVGQIVGEVLLRGAAHALKVLAYDPVIQDLQKRRLFELKRESFAQGAIKDRIA